MNLKEEIKKIARVLVADYVYDPDHSSKPSGNNWKRTEKGWSNADTSKIDYTKKFKKDDKVEAQLVEINKHGISAIPESERASLKKKLQEGLEKAEDELISLRENTPHGSWGVRHSMLKMAILDYAGALKKLGK